MQSLPDEIAQLPNLKILIVHQCGILSVPKLPTSLSNLVFTHLPDLTLDSESIKSFSRLSYLSVTKCRKAFATLDEMEAFCLMLKSTLRLKVLDCDLKPEFSEMVSNSLQVNGSIVVEKYGSFGARNKANHERTLAAVLVVLAIRRTKRGPENVPKDVIEIICKMLWIARCDVDAWTKK